jgi:hypothetical protein
MLGSSASGCSSADLLGLGTIFDQPAQKVKVAAAAAEHVIITKLSVSDIKAISRKPPREQNPSTGGTGNRPG